MFKIILIGIPFIILTASCRNQQNTNEQHKQLALQFFQSEYSGELSKIDSIASDEIVISYPIFEELFGKKIIQGRKAFEDFVKGFGERWKDPVATFHETIAEGNQVVLVWSFSARRVIADQPQDSTSNHRQSWGGITLFRFNEFGKIIAEVGEESSPGPFKRGGIQQQFKK